MASGLNRFWEPALLLLIPVINRQSQMTLILTSLIFKGIQQKIITVPLMKQYLEQEGELLSKAGNNGYEHYLKVRTRFNIEFSPYDFIFLSRAGFNGIMRFGKKGNWNIPFCKKPDRFARAYITKIANQVSNISKIIKPEPDWTFYNTSFAEIIPLATDNDIIYCDPPYYGRYVDYYNGWTEQDEELLFNLLSGTKAKFILSTWHHNDWRENEMISKFWNKFNIVTKDHFYHSGGNIENRRTIVEALVCNFNVDNIQEHNHGQKEKIPTEKLTLQLMYRERVAHATNMLSYVPSTEDFSRCRWCILSSAELSPTAEGMHGRVLQKNLY